MTNLDLLTQHVDRLVRRTYISGALFAVFIVGMLIGGFKDRTHEQQSVMDWLMSQHIATLISIPMVMLALLILPRAYTNTAMERAAESADELAVLGRAERLRSVGIGLRLVYITGAVLVLFLLPRMR
ncbi:MAG: hypothetical protein KC561_16375 [Myxococcales bacterium]|nr:hypothetical protein [Myxococcales bacterium]